MLFRNKFVNTTKEEYLWEFLYLDLWRSGKATHFIARTSTHPPYTLAFTVNIISFTLGLQLKTQFGLEL